MLEWLGGTPTWARSYVRQLDDNIRHLYDEQQQIQRESEERQRQDQEIEARRARLSQIARELETVGVLADGSAQHAKLKFKRMFERYPVEMKAIAQRGLLDDLVRAILRRETADFARVVQSIEVD